MDKYKLINDIEKMLLRFDIDTLKAICLTLENLLKGENNGRTKK